MKKSLIAAVALAALVGAVFTGCSKKESAPTFKVGVIYIGDANEG